MGDGTVSVTVLPSAVATLFSCQEFIDHLLVQVTFKCSALLFSLAAFQFSHLLVASCYPASHDPAA